MLFVVYTIMVSVSWGAWTIGREVDGLRAKTAEMSRDIQAKLDEQSALMQQQSVQLDQQSAQMQELSSLMQRQSAQLDQLLVLAQTRGR